VTELPPALAPWATELAIFPPDVGLGLGDLLARLSVAIGPLRIREESDLGAPNGFDGLSRRGPYERLLLTEWLFADHAPEEFLRRAASGEHAFLRLAHREPASARASIALFDAGPSQLGSPRVAQLAVLLVLARRAHAARARFRWGVLQADPPSLLEGVTVDSVRTLLTGRTVQPAGDAVLSRWQAFLHEAEPTKDRETWVIGGEEAVAAASRLAASTLHVMDTLEPQARRIEVDVRARSRAARSVSLELPAPRLVTRLLRDPFGSTAPSVSEIRKSRVPTSNLVFAASGVKVFARTSEAIYAYPVPNSPRGGIGKPKPVQGTWSTNVAAVGRHHRNALVLRAEEPTRTLHLSSGNKGSAVVGHFTTEEAVHAPWKPEPTDPLRPILVLQATNVPTIFFQDSRNRMFQLGGEEQRSPRLLARGVLAAVQTAGGVAFVAKEVCKTWHPEAPDGCSLVLASPSGIRATPIREPVEARLSGSFGSDLPVWTAVRLENEEWALSEKGELELIAVPVGSRVIAICRRPLKLERGILFLEPDARTFRLVGSFFDEKVLSAGDAVVEAAVDDGAKTLAFVTTTGELVVYSLQDRAILARFEPRDSK
jgi:hypothetical protein